MPTSRNNDKRTKVFISYSHQDFAALERLKVHLKPLESQGKVDRWDDTKILAGQDWKAEIEYALSRARVAILLVSADFLASSFITRDELPPILLAQEQQGLVILPIILRPCRFSRTPTLNRFQSINSPSKPLLGLTEIEQENIWVKLGERVEDILEKKDERPPVKPPEPVSPIEPEKSPAYINSSTRRWFLTIFGFGILGAGIAQIVRYIGPSPDTETVDSQTTDPTPTPTTSPTETTSPSSRLISGAETVFIDSLDYPGNEFLNLGNEAFLHGNYSDAMNHFYYAYDSYENNPEPLIFYNNAKARSKGNSIVLAVVVSDLDRDRDTSREILRGVAQSQNNYNSLKGEDDDKYLEIVIAKDSDSTEITEKLANDLVREESILGVIGHYASIESQTALPIYEKSGMAMISSTSTSTLLNASNDSNSSVFFRTVPSDRVTGTSLAKYAVNILDLKKVCVFYNPGSPYSESLKKAFEDEFINSHTSHNEERKVFLVSLDDHDFELRFKNRIINDKVDAAILFPDTKSTKEALDVAKANKDFGVKLLGGDSLYSDETLSEGQNYVEGMVLAVPWFRESEDPEVSVFSKASLQQWGGGVSWVTAMSFDATQAFLIASTYSFDLTRTGILNGLRVVDTRVNCSSNTPITYCTSGSPLYFTDNGETERESVLVKIQDGVYVLVQE